MKTALAAVGAFTVTVFAAVFAWVYTQDRRSRRITLATDLLEEQEQQRLAHKFGAG